MKEQGITATARLDRRLITATGGKRHLLIDLEAPVIERKEDETRIPLNLGLVIDASGSMQGEALEAAKQASAGVVEALREGDHLTVISFASDVVTHLDALADGEYPKDQARFDEGDRKLNIREFLKQRER